VRFQPESICHLDHFVQSELDVGREVLPVRLEAAKENLSFQDPVGLAVSRNIGPNSAVSKKLTVETVDIVALSAADRATVDANIIG
jgi:hypothetical protein